MRVCGFFSVIYRGIFFWMLLFFSESSRKFLIDSIERNTCTYVDPLRPPPKKLYIFECVRGV